MQNKNDFHISTRSDLDVWPFNLKAICQLLLTQVNSLLKAWTWYCFLFLN